MGCAVVEGSENRMVGRGSNLVQEPKQVHWLGRGGPGVAGTEQPSHLHQGLGNERQSK